MFISFSFLPKTILGVNILCYETDDFDLLYLSFKNLSFFYEEFVSLLTELN